MNFGKPRKKLNCFRSSSNEAMQLSSKAMLFWKRQTASVKQRCLGKFMQPKKILYVWVLLDYHYNAFDGLLFSLLDENRFESNP